MATSQRPSGWRRNTSANLDVRSNGVPSPRRPESVNVPRTIVGANEGARIDSQAAAQSHEVLHCTTHQF